MFILPRTIFPPALSIGGQRDFPPLPLLLGRLLGAGFVTDFLPLFWRNGGADLFDFRAEVCDIYGGSAIAGLPLGMAEIESGEPRVFATERPGMMPDDVAGRIHGG